MSNEKIYMPVKVTNEMYEREKPTCLFNEDFEHSNNYLISKYGGRNLVPTTEELSVGIMVEPATGIRKLINRKAYVVYATDEMGRILFVSRQFVNFGFAISCGRKTYKRTLGEEEIEEYNVRSVREGDLPPVGHTRTRK